MAEEFGNDFERVPEGQDATQSKLELLLSELETLIVQGRQLPFSDQRMIDPTAALSIIAQLREQLPSELKQAQWLLEHNQRILDDARHESEQLLRQAETRIAQMIDEHEITMRAQAYAEDTVLAAEESAQKIVERGTQYLDNNMAQLEETLLTMLDELRQNRQELK